MAIAVWTASGAIGRELESLRARQLPQNFSETVLTNQADRYYPRTTGRYQPGTLTAPYPS